MNRKKVLLVDEEKIIRDTYSFLLSKEGYSVVTADNGRKALETLYQQHFDLVITDFAIRNNGGCIVLEEVKTIFPTIPVMVFTDNATEIVRQFASLMGACALIKKPCHYEFLIAHVRSLLTRNKNRPSA
jgi:DNA-binding response OmpR family regulator